MSEKMSLNEFRKGFTPEQEKLFQKNINKFDLPEPESKEFVMTERTRPEWIALMNKYNLLGKSFKRCSGDCISLEKLRDILVSRFPVNEKIQITEPENHVFVLFKVGADNRTLVLTKHPDYVNFYFIFTRKATGKNIRITKNFKTSKGIEAFIDRVVLTEP